MDIETRFYSNGVPLACTICAPDEELTERRYPAVILCHGLSRHRNDGLDSLARVLAKAGVASLRFDFRGCGTQAHTPYQQLVSSELPEDIGAALAFAQTVPFVDPDRLGLAGISLGGSLAVWVSGAGDQRVKSTVSMAALADCDAGLRALFDRAGSNYDRFLERLSCDARIDAATGASQFINRMEMFAESSLQERLCVLDALLSPGNSAYISLRSVRSFIRLRPLDACARIRCPIYYMHGTDDALIDPTNAQQLYLATASSHKKIRIFPHVDHNMPLSDGCGAVFQEIAQWFAETLRVRSAVKAPVEESQEDLAAQA
ncbi:MAG: alpha/beta fold hydrolase [Oscillospiraceae bacterium]|jgi:dipeptidyl aminopeptidase/acylaminoacyl peptidase|nr:alpha/beta fold hydrolase [Oscillospiraceae bacterium]